MCLVQVTKYNMKEWKFGIDNNNLVKLVIEGKKRATTCPYYEEDIPIIGEESIILYDNGKQACKVKTKEYYVMKFCEMTEELSSLEGEGDLSLEYWRKIHMDYFTSFDKTFNDESLIIFEIFEVVETLDEK